MGEKGEIKANNLPITSQKPNEDQIQKIGLANSTNAVVLRVYIPPSGQFNPLQLSQNWTISIVGCAQAGPNVVGIYSSRRIVARDVLSSRA